MDIKLGAWVFVGEGAYWINDALIIGLVALAILGAWGLCRGYVPWENDR